VHKETHVFTSFQVPNSPFLFDVVQRVCPPGSLRAPDSAGVCLCYGSAVDIGGTCVPTAELVGIVAAVLAAAVCCAAARRRARRIAALGCEEEVKFRAAVEALRAQLLLTRPEGFFLTTDRLPARRRAVEAAAGSDGVVVYLQRSHLEAATRLGLLRDDADAKLVNALCVCVHGRPVQERRLCDWLLEVARALLDPAVVPASVTDTQSNSSGWTRADLELAPAGSAVSRGSPPEGSKSSHQRESVVVDEEEYRRRARYRYFQEKVAKVWAFLRLY
jgi:hypothetical protein